MTIEAMNGERPGLFARVRNILIQPQAEWRRIAGEAPGALINPYIAPLAILGAVVGLASRVAYGGFNLNMSLLWPAVSALLYVVFAVVGVLVAAFVINFLARRFGAEANSERAKQLAAYSATPILVAALAAIAPPVAGLFVGAGVIYAFVLLALGMQPLMPLSDPSNNVPRFTLTFAAIAAAIAALAAAFIGPLVNSGREALDAAIETVVPPPPAAEIPRRSSAEIAIDRLAQDYGASILSDAARLEEQFPDSLPGGFERQSVSHAQGGGVSRADGVYRQGAATLTLTIIQFDNAVDPAAFATLLDVKEDGATDAGYNRTQTIDSRFYAEEVSGATSRYIVIGRGVVMIAAGAVTMDQARAAVETIGLQRLEAMLGR